MYFNINFVLYIREQEILEIYMLHFISNIYKLYIAKNSEAVFHTFPYLR